MVGYVVSNNFVIFENIHSHLSVYFTNTITSNKDLYVRFLGCEKKRGKLRREDNSCFYSEY